ncbi:adenylosuccinate lyase [Candidatus Falkowbacteria bacterium CG10_big_fil_rev_8_21_14_0_10_44_15]|uniref:Adenylosuccinate lyase n=1 Tax=Candidatus Falkowbacteria bacterium CG10_big_fil_rev_8_21_14_0_10_44_15 TaxID=1974569 RepID=A0A2H0UZE1_9BACT|nr:MAG: adenylosuccinate lyase [Candidatus Falkowbacteria bacterium CG10_big_fil_rev_8_21_14_0_10_44_15]
MIPRYTLLEMGTLWNELAKKTHWLKVEIAVLQARGELGEISTNIHELARKVRITEAILARADELEKISDHDLIAFVLAVTEQLPEEVKPHFHSGLTSYDVEDTGLAMTLVSSLGLILRKMNRLRKVIAAKAQEHRNTAMIGRTHFIHAEPITFGLKLLGWLDVVERHIERLKSVRGEVGVGKISGAVGTYVLDPKIEELACGYLGLKPARISTQILSRDIIVRYISALVAVANSLDRFATEIRHLAGTDISEVAEFKRPGAKGSSAMPGKSFLRNPIKSENICSLARVMRGHLIPAFECEVVWCERTLENSAAERIFLPDATILLDFMLERFADTVEKLEVFPAHMERNLRKTGGIIFAQRVMLALTAKGMARYQAYDLVEGVCFKVERGTFQTEDEKTFRDLVAAHSEITNQLSPEEINACFDPRQSLKHVDAIFNRFDL